MDAFSLSLIYGTEGINKKDRYILSLVVGIYHFIMPLIGLLIGIFITKKLVINVNILVGILLSLIAVEMIISSFKERKETFLLSIGGFLLFGLSVSIDSLTVGIGLPAITNIIYLPPIVFSIASFIFTFLGLNIGNYLNEKFGKISTLSGGLILFIIGIFYIFK